MALVAGILGAAATARVPDPLKPGKLGVNVVEYEAGEIALTVPQLDGTSASFTQPLEGSVTFPTGPGRGRWCCSCTGATRPASTRGA